MKFYLTDHALKRMRERGIEPPNSGMLFRKCGYAIKKRIRKACPNEGFRNSYVYLRHGETIYVTAPRGISKYTVITAFKLTQ